MRLSLLPVLTYVQAHLDADLSLGELAARARLSPSHFLRTFRAEIGETPKQYTQRLRLESAALRLALHRTTVLRTALEVGFRSHEAFSRAFRARYGVPPREVLRSGLSVVRADPHVGREAARLEPESYELSPLRLVTLRPVHLAFVRCVGPYEQVGEAVWRELERWASRRGKQGPHLFLGLGYDAPGVTPADKLRFDAALRVEEGFHPRGAVGHQLLTGGRYAVATHVGPYSSLPAAYRELVGRLGRLKQVRFAGLPVLEMYHETRISVDARMNHTDLYLPVVPDR